MHVSALTVLTGLHLFCLIVIVYSRKKAKFFEKSPENEILEKTHIITMKFPNIDIPVNAVDRKPTVRSRRLDVNVEPFPENCKSKSFRNELSLLRQKMKCEPRETVINLIPPGGATITPNAVTVKRCGGMCNGYKRCMPVEQKEVKFYVKTIKNNQLYCSSIMVLEDVKCKCGCQQTADDCNENQIYNREKCVCTCTNEKDYAFCAENLNEDMHWDEKTCSCICQQSKSCTTGTYWIEDECRCAKILR